MLVEVENLNIHFETRKGSLHAIKNLSFSVEQGETLGIVGESGCGKSITNLALMGLLTKQATVSASKFKFGGVDLLSQNEKSWQKIRGKEMSMIFQDPMTALNPCFTVGFQIEETLMLHSPELSKNQRNERVIELLDQVGIPAPEERVKSYAHELSGGMAQRVMIAQAIASKPKLLIADEPTTALDVTIQDQILKLLRDIQKKTGMSIILVTHDLGVVSQNADRIQVMYAGEVVETAPTNLIINQPKHHYTKGLLESLPGKARAFRSDLPSIAGVVPDLAHRPQGCQFHPRCSAVQPECKIKNPSYIESGKQKVKCLFPLEGAR